MQAADSVPSASTERPSMPGMGRCPFPTNSLSEPERRALPRRHAARANVRLDRRRQRAAPLPASVALKS